MQLPNRNQPLYSRQFDWPPEFSALCGHECGVYQIENLLTGESYIGQATSILKRWKRHLYTAMGCPSRHTNRLAKEIRELGIKNFQFEVLEITHATNRRERERWWIAVLETLEPNGYNRTDRT